MDASDQTIKREREDDGDDESEPEPDVDVDVADADAEDDPCTRGRIKRASVICGKRVKAFMRQHPNGDNVAEIMADQHEAVNSRIDIGNGQYLRVGTCILHSVIQQSSKRRDKDKGKNKKK